MNQPDSFKEARELQRLSLALSKARKGKTGKDAEGKPAEWPEEKWNRLQQLEGRPDLWTIILRASEAFSEEMEELGRQSDLIGLQIARAQEIEGLSPDEARAAKEQAISLLEKHNAALAQQRMVFESIGIDVLPEL